MLRDADLAAICAEVYTDPNPSIGDPGGVRMYLRPQADELVVCFAGTPVTGQDAIAAWMRDFDAWPQWFHGLGVLHRGFGEGALEAWAQLHRRLPTAPVYTFTGHSLGGALACGAAACYASANPRGLFRLTTFGCPRMVFWGNGRFTRLIGQAYAPPRFYQRACDPVPHVPFKRLLWINWYQDWWLRIPIGEPLPGSDPAWLDPAANDQNHNIVLYEQDLRRK